MMVDHYDLTAYIFWLQVLLVVFVGFDILLRTGVLKSLLERWQHRKEKKLDDKDKLELF